MIPTFGRRGLLLSLLSSCASACLITLAGCGESTPDTTSPQAKEAQTKQEANIKDFYAKKAAEAKK